MGLPGSVSAAGADIPGLGDPGNAFCSSCVFGHCLVRQSDGEFVGEAEDFDCCCCWGVLLRRCQWTRLSSKKLLVSGVLGGGRGRFGRAAAGRSLAMWSRSSRSAAAVA